MKSVAVILAGGQGSRFWPLSRSEKPKQFLALGDSDASLLQMTAQRMEPLVGENGVLVVTNESHRKMVSEHLPTSSILCEPLARNTAPAIALAALQVQMTHGDVPMLVLPADHIVKNEDRLLEVFREAIALATERDVLVTIGVLPSEPHTGYGYIQQGELLAGHSYRVKRFYEKPSLQRAQAYVESGEYHWNSGMFVWRPSVFLSAVQSYMPELHSAMERLRANFGTAEYDSITAEVFEQTASISVDFGILEHASNCVVVRAADFGWSDVGSWDAWAEHFARDKNGNVLHGDGLFIDSESCIVNSPDRFTAVLGLKDVVVIDSGDALLVCPKSRVQEVKLIVSELKEKGRENLY